MQIMRTNVTSQLNESDNLDSVQIFDEKSFVCDSLEDATAMALKYISEQGQKDSKEVVRPKISFWREFLGIIFPILIYCAEIVTYVLFGYNVWIFVCALILTFIVFFPSFVIVTVLNYQKFAPESLRKACLFTPTCSEYMLLAIKKYGFIKGFLKGIKRLFRCHPPNGGIDEP